MEKSNDFDLSSLMCFENLTTCFDTIESDVVDGSTLPSWAHKNLNFNNQNLNNEILGSENVVGFFVLSDETVLCLVKKEKEYLPRDDYLQRLVGDMNLNEIRMEAIDLIWKVHEDHGFGPSSLSLAVNYLDRFLSIHKFDGDNDCSVQSLALACMSLAAKLEEGQNKVPKSADIEIGKPTSVFEANGIQRTELLVLTNLNWKMQSSTPCSYVDYFLRKINCVDHVADSSMMKSFEIIHNITKCIDFLEFKPSEIAAAVAIFIAKELQSNEIDEALQSKEIDDAVMTCFAVVEKDKILKCLKLMKNLSMVEVSVDLGNSTTSAPPSPVGVLDAACCSSTNDGTTMGSSAYSTPENPNTKRLKTFHDENF